MLIPKIIDFFLFDEAVTKLDFLRIAFPNFNELQIKKWLKLAFCNSLSDKEIVEKLSGLEEGEEDQGRRIEDTE